MDLNRIHTVYFLGIGGIGMSALARYFNHKGIKVSGYDRTPTQLTSRLIDEGMPVHFEDDPTRIGKQPDLVIYTPAIPTDLAELLWVKEKGYPLKKRSEILGELTRSRKTIAVAGTHGKTTVSTMIAHILFQSSLGCNAFLGGIAKNYDSNLLISPDTDYMVVEADEYDRSFLQLYPDIAVITSMDADHLDIYGDFSNMRDNFNDFVSQVHPDGTVIYKKDIELTLPDGVNSLTYSMQTKASFYADNIRQQDGRYTFDLHTPAQGTIAIHSGVPGLINVENAIAAAAATLSASVSARNLVRALSTFKGIKRRFDQIIKQDNLVYIDDYAHHPAEITGLVSSVRHMYPGKIILGIFQPHLYSRTRDFAEGFAESLDRLDEVILLPIYPAREKPIEGISSEMILRQMKNKKKSVVQQDKLINSLRNKDFEILLTIGAGNIDELVTPIKEFLTAEKVAP